MLGGILIFLAGTLCCMVADNLAMMLVGRAIESIGAAASLVTGRAMATDNSPAGKAAAPLAVLTSITLISPAVAPTVGGVITGLAGWRALFAVLAVLTLSALLLAMRMLGETRAGDRLPLHPRRLIGNYWRVVRHSGYLPLALANALISGGFYTFLAVTPFLLDQAGASPAMAGLFYSAVACAIIGGTLSVPLILRRWPGRLKAMGSAALGSGALTVIVVSLTGANLAGLLVAMCLMSFGAGLTGPSLLAEAIEQQRERASTATSLFGALQMGGAALISTAAVRLTPSPAVELAVIGLLVALALAARHLWGGAPAAN